MSGTLVGTVESPKPFPNRTVARLREYDYSLSAIYAVTICAFERRCVFGDIRNGAMTQNECGQIAADEWQGLVAHYPGIVIDEFVIMPNHVHGIIVVTDNPASTADMASHVPTRVFGSPQARTLSSIVGNYKSGVTRCIREMLRDRHFLVWQPRFYDHIIRDEHDLGFHREFIRNNPMQWQFDKENPDFIDITP